MIRLIAALCMLLPAMVLADTPVQVSVARPIAGAPPVFQAQPDPLILGRFVAFTAGGCAISFSAAGLRGLTWTGTCPGGRAQGFGTLMGYDYEQQAIFVYEGNIERGLRTNGVMHEVGRKGAQLLGWRIVFVNAALQPRSEVRFLDMPRPFLLALDDYVRQTEGKELLASMGAVLPPAGYPSPGVPVGGLTQQQISACSEEIKRAQIDSQRWAGDVNDVAARLGRMQKELFEGRCSGHPEAQAYIAGANRMLGHGANAPMGTGGSLPPLSAGSPGGSGSPDASRSRKVHNPAADAKGCTRLIQDTTRQGAQISGRFRFVNDCPTAVEFFWCSDSECTHSGNTWTIGVGRGWPVSGTNVRWGACRGANSGGFDKGSQGQRYTCPNLKW